MCSSKVTKVTEAIDECCICAALLGGEGEVSFPVLGTVTIKSCLGSYSINNYSADLMQWHSSVGDFWAFLRFFWWFLFAWHGISLPSPFCFASLELHFSFISRFHKAGSAGSYMQKPKLLKVCSREQSRKKMIKPHKKNCLVKNPFFPFSCSFIGGSTTSHINADQSTRVSICLFYLNLKRAFYPVLTPSYKKKDP